MRKVRNNQLGFGAVEVLLALIFVALVVFIGFYVSHANNKTTATAPKSQITAAPKMHTEQEAVSLVQKTYDDFVAAVKNAGPDNTQPLGIVGLNAVKGSLSDTFFTEASASKNGSEFSCAAQFIPSKYTATAGGADSTSAKVQIAISNSDDGSAQTKGTSAVVDLATLKITSVMCQSSTL